MKAVHEQVKDKANRRTKNRNKSTQIWTQFPVAQ